MDYPLLIPGIAQKIERVIKELKLRPRLSVERFIEKTEGKKHRYSSVCLDEKGKKVIFYARLHQTPHQKERMRTEVKLAEVFIKKPIFRFFPRYFKTAVLKDFEWLIREYFPSLPVEKRKEIEQLKKPLKKELVLKIVKAVMAMNNLPCRSFPFLKKFELKKYVRLPELSLLLLKEKVISHEGLLRLKELLRKNIKTLERENNYFCHGDFQIGNLLIFNKQMKIIDLESAHINNFAFDIAFFTTRLWQYPHLRKRFIEKFFELLPQEKRMVFPALFCLDTFFIGYHTFRSRPREYTLKKLQERENFYKKLLRAAIKNFSTLINLQ